MKIARKAVLNAAGRLFAQSGGVFSLLILIDLTSLALVGRMTALIAAPSFFSTLATASLGLATTVMVARSSGKGFQCGHISRDLSLLAVRRTTWAMAAAIPFTAYEAYRDPGGLAITTCVATLSLAQIYFQSTNVIQGAIIRGLGDFDRYAKTQIAAGALRFLILLPAIWGSQSLWHYLAAGLLAQVMVNGYTQFEVNKSVHLHDNALPELSAVRGDAINQANEFISKNQRSNVLAAAVAWIFTSTLSVYGSAAEVGKWALLTRILNILLFLPQRFADVTLTEVSKFSHKYKRNGVWRQGAYAFLAVAVSGCCMFAVSTVVDGSSESFSVIRDPSLIIYSTLTAGLMCLLRQRAQLEFASLATTFENTTAIVRFSVTVAGILAAISTSCINVQVLSAVRALSYLLALIVVWKIDFKNA